MKTIAVGVAAGLVLAYAVGYNQIYARQQGLIRLKKAEIAKEQANQKARQKVATVFQQLEDHREQLAPEPDSSWLSREVVAAGMKAGLKLTSITQEPLQLQKPFTRLAVGIQFTATYHQLGIFLDHLERNPRFIRIERLSTSNSPEGEGQSAVQLTVSSLYAPPASKSVVGAATSLKNQK